jgi:hypothetical protein
MRAAGRIGRGPLAGIWLATVAPAFCACQGPAIPEAALASAPPAAPPRDGFCASFEPGRVLQADPSDYQALIPRLKAGDSLSLAPGDYRRLEVRHVNGAPGRCITIAGPAGTRRAIIHGESGGKTVEIVDSSYVVIRNLVIDSRGIPGADGVKAPAAGHAVTHHVILDGNLIIGAGATQQTDGISTKSPAWNWIIRRNTILGAGTALYLGDSDGTAPFIAGIVEDNLILDPVGYGMQIKFQSERPALPGLPTGPQRTIIRNNLFKKSGRPSPDGDRPSLLVGGFPEAGPGSRDVYEISGNLFVDNPREALFQGSGRISFHDNVLIGGHPAAVVFRDHDLPLKLALVFNNRIFAAPIGIEFASPARQSQAVYGNVIVAETPIAGLGPPAQDNSAFTGASAP